MPTLEELARALGGIMRGDQKEAKKVSKLKFKHKIEGTKLHLQIAEQSEDLRYQPRDAVDTSKTIYTDTKTGWVIQSANIPEISWESKTLFVRGSDLHHDYDTLTAKFSTPNRLITFLNFLKRAEEHINGNVKQKPSRPSKFIKFDFSQIKSPRKRAIVQTMLDSGQYGDAMQYLRSLEGESYGSIPVNKFKVVGKADKIKDRPPGIILKEYNKRFDFFSSHKPSASLEGYGKFLGIEIECVIPVTDDYRGVEALVKWMNNNGLRMKYVNFTHDGSLRAPNGFFATEIRVLTRIDDFSNLEQLCKFLKQKGAKINKSCGLHVHLDMRSTEKEQDLLNLKARRIGNALNILAKMVPSSRRENQYCRLAVSRIDSGERYYAVNKTSYTKHKTLEIRLHSGTTNYEKIKNWCQLLLHLADCKKLTKNEPTELQDFLTLTDLSPELQQYVTERVEKFKTPMDSESDETPEPVSIRGCTFNIIHNEQPFVTFDYSHFGRNSNSVRRAILEQLVLMTERISGESAYAFEERISSSIDHIMNTLRNVGDGEEQFVSANLSVILERFRRNAREAERRYGAQPSRRSVDHYTHGNYAYTINEAPEYGLDSYVVERRLTDRIDSNAQVLNFSGEALRGAVSDQGRFLEREFDLSWGPIQPAQPQVSVRETALPSLDPNSADETLVSGEFRYWFFREDANNGWNVLRTNRLNHTDRRGQVFIPQIDVDLAGMQHAADQEFERLDRQHTIAVPGSYSLTVPSNLSVNDATRINAIGGGGGALQGLRAQQAAANELAAMQQQAQIQRAALNVRNSQLGDLRRLAQEAAVFGSAAVPIASWNVAEPRPASDQELAEAINEINESEFDNMSWGAESDEGEE